MIGNIVLITPPSHTHRTAEENIGIGYLATVLRKIGYLVTIIDGWLNAFSKEQIVKKILEVKHPILIGISCYECSLEDSSEIITSLRKSGCNTPIVGGGYGPTFHDEKFLHNGFNFVIRGEAEKSILQLTRVLTTKEIEIYDVNGLSWVDQTNTICRNGKSEPIIDLDSIPFPARDSIIETVIRKNPVHLVTSRGCQANCIFCSVASFVREMKHVSPWRSRSISNIVDEITHLHDTFGISCFKIVDDSFIEPPRNAKWAGDFASELKRRNLHITFRTQIRADRINREIVELLVEAGWFATSVGIENGSPTALDRMNKRATAEQNRQSLELLKHYGVYTQMGMILFDHKTTMVELEENLEFLSSLNWPVTKGIFTEMYAARGTPFTKILMKKKQIRGYTYNNYSYEHKDRDVDLAYKALKKWHRSHSTIYDRAINPISAPKVLPKKGYSEYHDVCLEVYKMDLAFFKILLDTIRINPDSQHVQEVTESWILGNKEKYLQISDWLDLLDNKYGLTYDAESNPFLN